MRYCVWKSYGSIEVTCMVETTVRDRFIARRENSIPELFLCNVLALSLGMFIHYNKRMAYAYTYISV
jgi:hypothetical protein